MICVHCRGYISQRRFGFGFTRWLTCNGDVYCGGRPYTYDDGTKVNYPYSHVPMTIEQVALDVASYL